MRKILLILGSVLILAITFATCGIAYAGGIRGLGLLGICFFFTGGVVVVLGQLIPAGILISSFVGTVISSFRKGEIPIRAT